ncbi:hypothetical protein M408DRAFT_330244 [Serendipita vermifera MAFF 305830]|uniref:Sugar phosphate phosphatase n=1 Tax=Serendipita vermifera MAFF 305830 TaxID=933852 RepID=A0A0C3ARG2_SERVB|nr:hypothetical protein M408DRAFT_330244 [Serendipita vermifera MAFF 305830]
MPRYTPPFPPYDPLDPKGFSYDTVLRRWPVILTGIINDILVKQDIIRADEGRESNEKEVALREGSDIIREISRIKYEMSRDFAMPKIEQDDGPNVDEFNRQLEGLGDKASWFKAPWLFAEYRLLRTLFSNTKYWHQHDPFLEQKNKTFRSSSAAVHKLAASLLDLDAQKEKLLSDEATLKALFGEMIHMCLWGNATDLSLLTNMTHEDIQKLQTVTKDEQAERAQYILLDNGEQAWDQLRKSHDRVDIVLDNDLILAEFLVSFMGVSKVVFHPKAIPWFVSDVTPPDFSQAITLLQKADEWSSEADKASSNALATIAARLRDRVSSGTFELSVPLDTKLGQPVDGSDYEFWTSPSAYYYMKDEAPRLLEHLAGSSLVIFKGDLKLTGDVKWPVSTSFSEAIGPLRGAFPILSLRTNKADVAVGVKEEVAAKLDAEGIPWRTNGKYALISFEPKA